MAESWRERYITANAPTVTENCIKDMLWYSASLRDAMADTLAYVTEYHYCDPIQLCDAVHAILARLTTGEAVTAFANKRREICVSPFYKTGKSYIKHEWETDKTASEIAALIAAQI